MLTNTNMNVGEIFVKHLGLENTNIVIKMKLGCIVLNALIDQEYLILTRESTRWYSIRNCQAICKVAGFSRSGCYLTR